MITKKELGAKIKELRLKKGLSQTELGKLLNRSHAAISDIERGKTDLTVIDLLTIAEYLNEPITYILNIQSSPSNRSIQYSGRLNTQVESNNQRVNITDNQQNASF